MILWYGKENIKVQTKFWNKLKEKVDKSYDIPMNAVTEKYTKFCEDMTNDYFLRGKTYGQGIYVVRLKKIKKSTEKLRGKWGYFYEYTIKDLVMYLLYLLVVQVRQINKNCQKIDFIKV